MVGSSSDAPKGPAALVMETEAGYTAYFYDNDPREREAMYTDAEGQTKHLGAPLPEAVFRTNHGYDPKIRKTYMWGVKTHAFRDSVDRYFILSNTIAEQGTTGAFGWMQAVNTTSILGQKVGVGVVLHVSFFLFLLLFHNPPFYSCRGRTTTLAPTTAAASTC